jgi:hypothetical protein
MRARTAFERDIARDRQQMLLIQRNRRETP